MPTPITLTVSWSLKQLCGASDGPLRGLHHWLRDREGQSPVKSESLHTALLYFCNALCQCSGLPASRLLPLPAVLIAKSRIFNWC